MKLLFDENLSYRLTSELADVYPESAHVRDVGLLGADDLTIWEHAAVHAFLRISKDTDFYQRSLLFGALPKVIWLCIGDAGTQAITELLRKRYRVVRRFAEDFEAALLTLGLV